MKHPLHLLSSSKRASNLIRNRNTFRKIGLGLSSCFFMPYRCSIVLKIKAYAVLCWGSIPLHRNDIFVIVSHSERGRENGIGEREKEMNIPDPGNEEEGGILSSNKQKLKGRTFVYENMNYFVLWWWSVEYNTSTCQLSKIKKNSEIKELLLYLLKYQILFSNIM